MSTVTDTRLTNADRKLLDSLKSDVWTETCALVAYEEWFSSHRGAADHDEAPDEFILYGNDGFDGTDDRSKLQVALLVRMLRVNGIEILGFGTHEDYTWAMRVEGSNQAALHQAVWYCWFRACGNDHRFAVSVVGKMALKVPRIRSN